MKLKHICFIGLTAFAFSACSDLQEKTFGQMDENSYFKTDDQLKAATAACYSQLKMIAFRNYMMSVEANSDAFCVPTRGTGWYDGGEWRNCEAHNITAVQAGTYTPQRIWEENLRHIALCTYNINAISNSDVPSKDIYVSEIRTIRAYLYYIMSDLFGDMPLLKNEVLDPLNLPARSSRTEVMDFVISELNDVKDKLPDGGDDSWFPRMTKQTAEALLARVYLNAEVYYGKAMYDKCLELCNSIISSGKYKLVDDYYDNFKVDNHITGKDEAIFYIDINTSDVLQNGKPFFNLVGLPAGFKQKYGLKYGPWNGICLEPSFFNSYDQEDYRFKRMYPGDYWDERGILFGIQYNADGTPMMQGSEVVDLRPTEVKMIAEKTTDGARLFKWEPDNTNPNQDNGQPIIRYSDILLMKAECLLRLNGVSEEVNTLVNDVRKRNFGADKWSQKLYGAAYNGKNVELMDIFRERGWEFSGEGLRRIDQIRFDKLFNTWINAGDFVKDSPDGRGDGDWSKIWPIPQSSIDVNPKLTQNPNY